MTGPNESGDWSPEDIPPNALPGFPEEWGVIVIPDDLSELTDEVEAIRAELRLTDTPVRWRRLLRRPGVRRTRLVALRILRAPALIVTLALLITLGSLVASAWPTPPSRPLAQRSAANPGQYSDALPALELFGTDGIPVPLREQLPAVILLTDGCPCNELVRQTTLAVPAKVAVVIVAAATAAATGKAAPSAIAPPPAQGKSVRLLRDGAGTIRNQLRLAPPDGTAAAVLVDQQGRIVHRLPSVASVEQLRPYLATL